MPPGAKNPGRQQLRGVSNQSRKVAISELLSELVNATVTWIMVRLLQNMRTDRQIVISGRLSKQSRKPLVQIRYSHAIPRGTSLSIENLRNVCSSALNFNPNVAVSHQQ